MKQLKRRVDGIHQIEGEETRYNEWIFQSTDLTNCTFPSSERIQRLALQTLGSIGPGKEWLVEVGDHPGNFIMLKIRQGADKEALNQFQRALEVETISP